LPRAGVLADATIRYQHLVKEVFRLIKSDHLYRSLAAPVQRVTPQL